jgi:RNA polymerase sigma factor (TIGR02999 family)
MRRILVDQARRKRSLKRGGEQVQQVLNIEDFMAPQMKQDILILDEALELLAQTDPQVAELVKLRYFVGLSNKESAALLGLSPRTADNYWAYAKSWLLQKIESMS